MNAPLYPAAATPAIVADRRPRPEIAVFGEWDTSNLGDRGIHRGVLRFLAECGWNARSFGLSSLAPVPADAAYPAASASAPGSVRAMLGAAPRLKRVLREARQRMLMAALSPRLAQARAILVGGGALLSDADLHFPQSLVRLARFARRHNAPLFCLGCSIEGEWSERGSRMIREFLAACDVVAVRDHATAGRLTAVLGAPPPVFGDFCLWETCLAGNGTHAQGRCAYAVNVSQLAGAWSAEQAHYEEALVVLTRRLAQRAQAQGMSVRIFTTGTPEDARAAQRVFASVAAPGVELHLPDNLAQLSAMLRASAVVVSTRLHAAILALAEKAPTVGFSAGPKVRDFFSTLGIQRCAYDVDGAPRLVDWLPTADYEALYAEQRRVIVHAPVWGGRARVHRSLQLLADVVTTCK
jgi:polysaccharide pyruvyl transferase WcaK-like protein